MKNLLNINLAILLALFLITSCSNDKDEVLKEGAINQTEMQNKANPYDEQGVMYNGFLNAIIKEQGTGGWDVGQLTEANGVDNWDVGQIAQFNGDIGGWDVGQLTEANGVDNWDVGQVISFALGFNGSNGKDSSDKAERNLSMQLEAFSGMQNISSAFECQLYPDRCPDYKESVRALDPSNGGTAHDRTIKYINNVRDQEAKIQENDKINEAEKKAFLISCSIARYAAGYWYNESLNSDEPTSKTSINMVQLSILGATTAFTATDTEEVGIGTAILSAYIAAGGGN